jgi:hypothetical protein
MSQARNHNTKRKTASLLKSTPALRSPPVPARPAIDPTTLPDIYCLKLDGTCLDPLIPDRSAEMLNKSESYEVGDVVCIWFKPEAVQPGANQAWLKRLTMNVPPWVKSFPYTDHPKSDVLAIIVVEQLNPPISYRVKCRDILAIHKAVGYSPFGPQIGGTVSSADIRPIGVPEMA